MKFITAESNIMLSTADSNKACYTAEINTKCCLLLIVIYKDFVTVECNKIVLSTADSNKVCVTAESNTYCCLLLIAKKVCVTAESNTYCGLLLIAIKFVTGECNIYIYILCTVDSNKVCLLPIAAEINIKRCIPLKTIKLMLSQTCRVTN